MKKFIPYSKQYIDQNDLLAINKALRSDLITSGPKVLEFENNFKKKFNSKYAVSCSNGTAALHLAFLAINLKPKDVIILPVVNFIAATNMAYNLGAKICFADIDPYTSQMTPQTLIDCIKKNKLKKIKAVVVMHNGGEPNYFIEFNKLRKKYKFILIEDACHSLGGKYSIKKNIPVGSCKFSDITVFSFHAIKNITTCEGGMITTNNKKIYDLIKLFRNHGIKRNFSTQKKYYWEYQIEKAGFNYRLNDVQSALGVSQLKKLDKFLKIRKKIKDYYIKNLIQLRDFIVLNHTKKDQFSGNHLFIICFKKNKKNFRDSIIKKFYNKKIITQFHYIPIYKFNFYKKICKGNFPGAEQYYRNGLSLPIFVSLKLKDVKKICFTLKILINKNY